MDNTEHKTPAKEESEMDTLIRYEIWKIHTRKNYALVRYENNHGMPIAYFKSDVEATRAKKELGL